MAIRIETFVETAGTPFKDELAQLRITVFREFPYLYDGTLENEESYLETQFQAKDSLLVVAFDGEKAVGASTAMPLETQTAEIQQPWIEHGDDLSKIFYFSESVLLPEYRGQGIGLRFFEERENWARSLGGFELLTFCGVVRPEDHPLRPAGYVPLDKFWNNRGFKKKEGYLCSLSWKQVDGEAKAENALQFWDKPI